MSTSAWWVIPLVLWGFYALYPIVIGTKTIKISQENNFNIYDFIVYFIAYYYVIFASVNDGFSGFLLGMPYAIFLFYEVQSKYGKSIIVYFHIAVLVFAMFVMIIDRSDSTFFYPMVGKTYTTNSDINYSYGCNLYDIQILQYMNSLNKDEKQIFTLKKDSQFMIKKQILTGNPDFDISYKFEIQSEAFLEFKKYINTIKTSLDHENKTQLYISRYDLKDLLESQRLLYVEKGFINADNVFIYMSFYIFIYPIIFLVFLIANYYRDKKRKKIRRAI